MTSSRGVGALSNTFLGSGVQVQLGLVAPRRGRVERAAQLLVAGDHVADARAHRAQPLRVAPQLLRALAELRVAHEELRVHYLDLSGI